MINRQGPVSSNWVNCTLGLINEELNNTLPLAVFAFTPTFVPGISRLALFGVVLHVTVTSPFSRFNSSGSLACALAAFSHSIIFLSVPLYLSVCSSLSLCPSLSLSLSFCLSLSVCPLSFCLSLSLYLSVCLCLSLLPFVGSSCCTTSHMLPELRLATSRLGYLF